LLPNKFEKSFIKSFIRLKIAPPPLPPSGTENYPGPWTVYHIVMPDAFYHVFLIKKKMMMMIIMRNNQMSKYPFLLMDE